MQGTTFIWDIYLTNVWHHTEGPLIAGKLTCISSDLLHYGMLFVPTANQLQQGIVTTMCPLFRLVSLTILPFPGFCTRISL